MKFSHNWLNEYLSETQSSQELADTLTLAGLEVDAIEPVVAEKVSDVVVGQIQRYMGFVTHELAEGDQMVKGIIIALEDDLKIRRALSVASGIEFYRYELSFNLTRAG